MKWKQDTLVIFYWITLECSATLFEKIPENKELELKLGYNEDAVLNFTELTKKYGYYTEEHIVITEDEYVLTIFRIPKGKNCNGAVAKTPLILKHGTADCSDAFILAGPNIGLAYLLADQCYDIWLPNHRGNRYSRRHTYLNPDNDGKFWDFTFNENGLYDLSAIIDYILKETKSDKANYIANSQGTTDFFVLMSSRPEYNEKINLAILLAPEAWMSRMFSPEIHLIAAAGPPLLKTLKLTGTKEILANNQVFTEIGTVVGQVFPRGAVGFGVTLTSGINQKYVSKTTLATAYGHYPAGTSVDNILHFSQAINIDRFAKYDYGKEKNLELYGVEESPEYKVNRITAKVALICGDNDWLVSLEDVKKLRSQLQNVVEYQVLDGEWSHAEFVWGDRIPKILAPLIYNYLDKYSSE